MTRTLVLAVPTLLLAVSLAPAQTYSDRGTMPSDSQMLQKGYLRREATPDTGAWIQSDRSPEDAQFRTLTSAEYYTRAGGTNPSYVRQLYADVIGREPLPAEINYWVGRLSYQPREDVVHQMMRFHPRNVSIRRVLPANYDPGYFPDPASPTFCDPSGPYFHSPYFYNYEKSRSIRAFSLAAQG
jgi:hypothetical protein